MWLTSVSFDQPLTAHSYVERRLSGGDDFLCLDVRRQTCNQTFDKVCPPPAWPMAVEIVGR